jgi:hypothetical protein
MSNNNLFNFLKLDSDMNTSKKLDSDMDTSKKLDSDMDTSKKSTTWSGLALDASDQISLEYNYLYNYNTYYSGRKCRINGHPKYSLLSKK